MQSCSHHCISFYVGDDGFMLPSVDKIACIHCKRCVAVCPYSTGVEKKKTIQSYSVKAMDVDAQKESSSGGCFYGLARRTLEDGGVVFGAAMNEDFSCEHRAAKNVQELLPLLGSKYVQSRSDKVFPDILKLLKDNTLVLFVGTPCQIAGLKNYIGREYDQLVTVDIACHGVPSFSELKKCIAWLERKHGGKITYLKFRDKNHSGWNHSLTYDICKDGKIKKHTIAPYKIPYYYFFLHSKNIRMSCYTCPYVGVERIGDITLADFWAAERIYPESKIGSGISVALCNTEKGIAFLKRSKEYLVAVHVDNELATQDNQPFNIHPEKYKKRDELLREVLKNGYVNIGLYYTRKERIIAALKAAVPEKTKRILLRAFGGKR